MDGGVWWAAVHGVTKSQTRLSDFTFTFHFCALEKALATHSSVLAWRIPGTAEPGGLPSMGSHRVGHDWSDLAAAAVHISILFQILFHYRLLQDIECYTVGPYWLSILPRKSHRRRSLVGCSPWGREESDMTERIHFHFSLSCIGEANGNPLQCSCLENPRDGGAWWAAVCGVTQSQTRLKQISSSSNSNLSSL